MADADADADTDADDADDAAAAAADAAEPERRALVERLEAFARKPRSTIVSFAEFERSVLRRPFRAIDERGRLGPDVFHRRLAEHISASSIGAFAEALFAAVDAVPGAFAPLAHFENTDFFLETQRLLRWATNDGPSSFLSALRELWKAVDRDFIRLRAMCSEQLTLLGHFGAQLQNLEQVIYEPEVLQRLARNPPAQFAASLAASGVFLDDLKHVLPTFSSSATLPVSQRTYQLAAAAFVDEHFEALQAAVAAATSTLRTVLKLDFQAAELEAIEVYLDAQPGSVPCALPAHLFHPPRLIYLLPGKHSQLGATIPSFRICRVLYLLCKCDSLVKPSCMCVDAFVPLVRRLLAESEWWRLEPPPRELGVAQPLTPERDTPRASAAPSPTPSVASVASVASAASAASAASVASRASLASLASLVPSGASSEAAPAVTLDARLYKDGSAALLRDVIERRFHRDARSSATHKVTFTEVAEALKTKTGARESLSRIVQFVARELRAIAKNADVRVVAIGKEKRMGFHCSRDELHRLYIAAAQPAR